MGNNLFINCLNKTDFQLRKPLITSLASMLLFMQISFSQSLRQPISAIYLGLNAYSTKHTDPFSFVKNQAALVQNKNVAAGVYGERRFMLAATGLYNAVVVVPSKLGNFGLNIKYAGAKNFNENQIGLAYGKSLGSKVDIGIQFNYYSYKVPTYINASTVNVEIGAIVHLTDQLNAGIHIYNPVGGKLSNTDEKLTTAYTIGLGYDASDKFFVSTEVVKEEDHPVNLNVGMQYQFMKQLFARAGISTVSSAAYGGVGVGFNNLRLDVSGSYHPQLGWSPGLLLIIQLGARSITDEQPKENSSPNTF